MSTLKISDNLFLEKQELNRFKKFIQLDGIKQNLLLNTESFGLFEGYNTYSGTNKQKKDCFRVEVSSTPNSIDINTGRALDKNGDLISLDSSKTLLVPGGNIWYWLKISYFPRWWELGTCSIDATGHVTGSGTKFTEVFRGQPNYPNKVKFTNATSNVQEYEVLQVIDDSNMILLGDFSAESNLQATCVGTFTSGFVPAAQDKQIYDYDDVAINWIQETVTNTKPNHTTNVEFFIARARINSGVIELQDKRENWFKTKSTFSLESVLRAVNPVIGVESVKWDIPTTPMYKNEVNIAWGYRSSNWSINTAQNLVTINSGLGGVLKENILTNFINGMFDGWRLYVKSGKYFKVISSVKQGSQLNIKLDVLHDFEFNTGEEIRIVPDSEEIEIRAKWNGNTINEIIEEKQVYHINLAFGKFYVRIPSSTANYLYNFTYRYKTLNNYSDWFPFSNDSVGFYAETSFDQSGILKTNPIDRVQKPYTASLTAGFIEIVPNPRNFGVVLSEIVTGDKFGVDHKTISNANTVYDLIVGKDRTVQILHCTTLTVANDIFINLNKVRFDTTPAINGNKFLIQLDGNINLNTRKIRIVTNYVNPGTYTLIRELSQADVDFINANQWITTTGKSGLTYLFNYDGTNWCLNNSNENYLAQFASINNSLVGLDNNINAEIVARIAGDATLDTNKANTSGNNITSAGTWRTNIDVFSKTEINAAPTSLNVPNWQSRLGIWGLKVVAEGETLIYDWMLHQAGGVVGYANIVGGNSVLGMPTPGSTNASRKWGGDALVPVPFFSAVLNWTNNPADYVVLANVDIVGAEVSQWSGNPTRNQLHRYNDVSFITLPDLMTSTYAPVSVNIPMGSSSGTYNFLDDQAEWIAKVQVVVFKRT